MQQILRLGLGLLALLSILAGARGATDSFFPLMAWDDVRDEATLQKMADCGVNMVAFVPPRLLKACNKRGLKAIVFDERVSGLWNQPFNSKQANEVLTVLIKKVNSNPAVFGYHLKDEPDASQFDELAKSSELVRKLAPGKWPYINMTPGMGAWYGTNFLEAYITKCKPPILSYDNYAIGESGNFSYGFWANIWDIRGAALRHDLPFWPIILTVAHWNYRYPSAADLRLQMYGSLVYGARGICFYKFCSEPLSILGAPDLGNFHMGPLDEFGEKTVTWDNLRNVNRQIKNLASVLLKLHSDDVYHVGTVPERNHGITKNDLVQGLASGQEFVIGDFTHEDGSRWVMIVNKDLQQSAFCRPKFAIAAKAVKYVSPVTGRLAPFPAPWYALAPGQGVLLKVE